MMSRTNAMSILLMLLTVGPVAVTPFATGHGTLPGPDRMTITIDEPSKEVNGSESEKTDVLFYGNVTVNAIPGERVAVTLVAEVNMGWPCSIDPHDITVRDNIPVPFTVNVSVHENWLAGHPGILNVSGTSRGGGITTYANALAIITIRPYYRTILEAEGSASRTVSPGNTAEFIIRVWSYGNSVDNKTIGIANQNELRSRGWETRVNVTRLENLRPTDYGRVALTVIPPKDIAPYKDEVMTITLRVESEGASSQGNSTYSSYDVKVHVKGASPINITWIAVLVVVVVLALAVFLRKRRMRRAPLARNGTGGPPK